MNIRPPTFAYPGGKARLANRLISMFPLQASRFVDLFAGRGNVFFPTTNLCYDQYWINDLYTAPFFHALIRSGKTLIVPERHPQWYHKHKGDRGTDDSILLEPYLTVSGMGYDNAGFRNGSGGATRIGYERSLRNAHDILVRTKPTISQLDWTDCVSQLSAEDFVFVDPPYIDRDVGSYSGKQLNHKDLVNRLSHSKFRWLLTEYAHPLYIESLGVPFLQIDVDLTMSTTKQYGQMPRDKRVECVWKNF